ncbi:c-type cytochrome biogenesis protein CcmI [Roseibium litorale]|uniref:C-type cytochrome biogenesis protein CcmI n=1 Tax=Roseibium litorale TaxID=2803841 RepID=A0ABR9CRH7_9HYPH|nr:c-type cytochrome biogenesis protein CcmI [Roseibium litorale]MBD8893476.1 c-type cytochrome biogenesis protein CcmI [Roseibium litorale]
MIFWILIAALTAVAALSVLVPFARANAGRAGASLTGAAADAAVYRQQLSEVDKDLERGMIDAEAAKAARTEIARRLLSAADAETAEQGGGSLSNWPRKLVFVVAAVLIPAAALGIYGLIGQPDLPDQPLVARLSAPAETQSVATLVARVERHLADNPEDGQGWEVLAPVYLRLGNAQSAAQAYFNTIRLLGPTSKRQADYGEALTMANSGIVSADARASFEKAVELDPKNAKARFFLALALGQEGKTGAAVVAWTSLLEGADPKEPWVPAARMQLAELKGEPVPGQAGAPVSGAQLPGPSAADVSAAQSMSADDRTAMIRGMVENLAGRLADGGGTVDEWLRLIRAYMVLGEKGKAEEALTTARQNLADNAEALSQINAFARDAGL